MAISCSFTETKSWNNTKLDVSEKMCEAAFYRHNKRGKETIKSLRISLTPSWGQLI